jgi:lysophospholipase L1-like esterase
LKNILFLGDSYTIGEGLPLHENFPSQLVQLLRKKGKEFSAPEIIAQTGFTTDELIALLNRQCLQQQYHYVTLLIGVNNAYRGRTTTSFESEFEYLVKFALSRCIHKNKGVFILSIPDYSYTPFVKEEDKKLVSGRIESFNAVCKKIAGQLQTDYTDITGFTRSFNNDNSFLAADLLHYSAKTYLHWSKTLFEKICTHDTP